MASHYSVIQYVPDPIADERINLGVLAFDNEVIHVQFLDNWKRIHCFGHENIEFLKDFALQMQDVTEDGLFIPGETLDETLSKQERLLKISQEWQNILQITPPRKSLGEVESVLEQMSAIFLKEPLVERKAKPRDRQVAAQVARSTIRVVLKNHFKSNLVRELLNKNNTLQGKRESHHFDATVLNGQPFFAVHGMSFEVQTPKATTEAVSWMITDVRERNTDIPLAVLVFPPRLKMREYDHSEYDYLQKMYEQKKNLYQELGATVLNEQDLANWANEQIPVKV
jgi:hypothetical protein